MEPLRKKHGSRTYICRTQLEQSLGTSVPDPLIVPSVIFGGFILETIGLKNWVKSQREQQVPVNVWAIDLRTLAHPIARELESQDPFSNELAFLSMAWGIRLTKVFDQAKATMKAATGSQDPELRIVLCDDYPDLLGYEDPANPGTEKQGYWRHKIYPGYKAGRKPKPKSWNTVTKVCYQTAMELGIPVLREPYFEADDILAHLARHRTSYPIASLGIWTVDTDLLQLVTDSSPQVYWYNVLKNDRYRDEAGTLAYWLKRHKTEIQHPTDIITQKAVKGDPSDALPPGTDPGLLDLWTPKEPFEQDLGWLFSDSKPLSYWQQEHNRYLAQALIHGKVNVDI